MANRNDINWVPCSGTLGKEEISATAATAVPLSATKIAYMKGMQNLYMAKVQVTAYPCAWQEDGSTATGSDAQVASVGDIIFLDSLKAMDDFSAIGVGGTSVLAVTYYQAC